MDRFKKVKKRLVSTIVLVKCVCIMYLCSCSSFQSLTIVRSEVHRSIDSHSQQDPCKNTETGLLQDICVVFCDCIVLHDYHLLYNVMRNQLTTKVPLVGLFLRSHLSSRCPTESQAIVVGVKCKNTGCKTVGAHVICKLQQQQNQLA